MINVLEHIADDQGVLREISERLEPGRCLVHLGAGLPAPLQLLRHQARSRPPLPQARARTRRPRRRLRGRRVALREHAGLVQLAAARAAPAGRSRRRRRRSRSSTGTSCPSCGGSRTGSGCRSASRCSSWPASPAETGRDGAADQKPVRRATSGLARRSAEAHTRRRVGDDAEHRPDAVAPADLLAVVVGAAVVADADLVDPAAAARRSSR